MKKEDFSTLLTDLYQAYNPEYVQYVPQLVEKYSRMEHSAVSMVLLKYNRKNASFYDPNKDKDEYIHYLIKEYSEGRRPLKDFRVQSEHNSRKEEVENKMAEESKKFQENIVQTIEGLKKDFAGKEQELIQAYEIKIKELNERIATAMQPVKQGMFDDIEIKIISNYTEYEVKLPNKEALIGMGVGARIVTSTTDGSKMIGLKVLDIVYDCVSNFNGKPIIEIIVDRE
jgi:hypothetical protein